MEKSGGGVKIKEKITIFAAYLWRSKNKPLLFYVKIRLFITDPFWETAVEVSGQMKIVIAFDGVRVL